MVTISVLFLPIMVSAKIATKIQRYKVVNKKLQLVLAKAQTRLHIGAISMSVILPEQKKPNNFVVGSTSLKSHVKITPKNLFQIGSLTKTFTA